jgi:hypothetical protein
MEWHNANPKPRLVNNKTHKKTHMKLKTKIARCPRSISPHWYYLDAGTEVYPISQSGDTLTVTAVADPANRIPSEDFFQVHMEGVE